MKSNNPKILIEDCHVLKLSHFPRGIYRLEQCNGEFNIRKRNIDIPVSFEIIQRRIDPYIKICFKKAGKYRWQSIGYDIESINLGIRSFLLCNCGHRANKLFLPPNGDKFLCAKCWDLRYLTQTINRQILGAEFFYRHSRLLKLNKAIKELKRVKYADKPTSRVQNLARMAFKWVPNKDVLIQMQKQLNQICAK